MFHENTEHPPRLEIVSKGCIRGPKELLRSASAWSSAYHHVLAQCDPCRHQSGETPSFCPPFGEGSREQNHEAWRADA
jgi:hypothetical protein